MEIKSTLLIYTILTALVSAKLTLLKADTPAGITIHPTNRTTVRNITEIVHALECLRQAVETFSEDKMRAEAYAALYAESVDADNSDTANTSTNSYQVLVGYSGFYVQKGSYIEAEVIDPTQEKRLSKDKLKNKGKLYLLFTATSSDSNATTLRYP